MHRSKAFTIVELIIVIAIIGILATISALSFTHFQAQSRDAQRASKVSVIAEALEKYYDANGEYPSCVAMTADAATLKSSTLSGIDEGALKAPNAPTGTTNSLQCADLTGAAGEADYYAYVGDSSTACTSGLACLQFTLKYREESTGNIVSIESRRNTKIATSGVPTINASATGFSTANVSWTAIDNAANYTLQRATNTAFTANLVTTSSNGASAVVSSLTENTTYYFRVRANSPNSVGDWSNTDNLTTWTLSTPTLTATTNSSTQVTTSWAAISHASSYTVQYSTSSTFASGVTTTSTASTSKPITGLPAGTTYYFRVQATNGSYSSSWSATKSATTSVNNPSGTPTIAAAIVSSSTARGTAGSAGTCEAGTTMAYQIRYHSTNVAADGAWSSWVDGTTRDVAALQGNTYTFQVQARCEGPNASSGYDVSGTANTVRPISTPAAPGWAITTEWAAGYNYNMWYTWSCPAGTSIGSNGVSSNSGGASQATPWVDWWYVGWNSGQYESWHTYNGQYTCQTAYASANSPVTSTQIHAYCSPARRSFSSYPRCDNYGQGQAGNGTGN